MSSRDITFSVLMPLFYKEKPAYLDNCLNSIYNQTLLPNEIILVKEGNLTSEHHEILNKWRDHNKKIPLKIIDADIENVKGLPACLNLGIAVCESEYIARFDTDDENLLDRFEKQIAYLKSNRDIVLLGGQIEEYNETLQVMLSTRKVPEDLHSIKKFSTWRNPFNHQTVFYKTQVAKQLGGYPNVASNEDYAFWGKFIVKMYPMKNLPSVLVKARTGTNFYDRRRGLRYLKGELESVNSLYKSRFYTLPQFIIQIVLRVITRFLPNNSLKYIYKFLR